MNDINKLEENLIHSWLALHLATKENKYVKKLSFNEIATLHYIKKSEDSDLGYITAKELSFNLHMLKSQVNLLIKQLLKKGYINRTKNTSDKRIHEIRLTKEGLSVYEKEHEFILNISNRIIEVIGLKSAEEIVDIFTQASEEFRKIN